MSHIFISHTEQDAEIALEIALELEKRGYTTWCYEIDSIPGPSYLVQTGQAIEQAQSFILIISQRSIGSRQVTNEVVRAHESGKYFIPILRDIRHIEFQNLQPEWREAVGAATSIRIPPAGVAGILERIIAGLNALGIQPVSRPDAARIDRIDRSLDEFRTRNIPKKSEPESPITQKPAAKVDKGNKKLKALMPVIIALGSISIILMILFAAGFFDGGSIRQDPTPESNKELNNGISPKAISPANIEQVTRLKELEIDHAKQLAWSPDNKLLAIAASGLYLIDTQTLKQKLKIDLGWVDSVAFSPDGQTIATASYDGVKLWSSDGGGELGTITNIKDAKSVTFSPDGTKLAVAVGMTVKLFDVATKSELKTFIGHQSYVDTVAFSSDGQTLASGSDGIKLWDVASGRELQTLKQNNVFSVAFSPDGKILASGSVGSYDDIKLWDVASGYLLRTLTGHTKRIHSVAFSPDGKLLASVSWDLTVRLWDTGSGKELRILTGHTGWLNSAAFSPDGSILASGADDEVVRLWGIVS